MLNHIVNSQAGVNGENIPGLLQGKRGVYGLIPVDASKATGFDASGHIDLINNQVCNGGCYFNPRGGGIKNIYIWLLQ